MLKQLASAMFLLFITTAATAAPQKTEFVSGDGLLWSSFGRSVDFAIDASQLDPNAAEGWLAASFFSFPSHLIMTLESTALDSVEVDRDQAGVSGTALVVDARSGFEGVVAFTAEFQDAKGRKKNRPQNDTMVLTVFLPTGTEIFEGPVISGDVEVGTRRP
ncbi:MAG: hypothetical protein R3212_03255 [Xanthomonadales bacterium]|nr:hypothetical protein [Xanthomonadales bacterium]